MKQQNPYIKLSNPGKDPSEIIINFNNVRKVLSTLRALNHKSRERLLEHLDDLNDAATLENITYQMRLEKTIVQEHLKILLRNEIIIAEKNAANQMVYYRNDEKLLQVKKFVDDLNQ